MKKLCLLFISVLMIGITLHAQTSVSGVVLSESDGQPVIGATVVAKGASVGTVTDVDGKFKLQVPANVKTVVVSYVGMKSAEQPISATMRVLLKDDSQMVDEVVVTALGISRSQKSIGYAATNVSSDEILGAKQSSVISSLAGKVAGVSVNSSGDPGSSSSIVIRGFSSLNGNNQPLFVVDGVPMQNNANFDDDLDNAFDFGNGANNINPADIQNMTILKGAAATALYGSRAANGVVMITTKSGKGSKDKLNIELNHSSQMSNILRLPDFQNQYGMGWGGYRTIDENGSWGPRFDGVDRVYGPVYNHSQQLKAYKALPNNIRDFFETGWNHMTDLSLSGTSGKASYYASFSATNDDGMMPTDVDKYERYTLALRGSYNFKYIKISSAFNWADQSNSYSSTGQGLTAINHLYQTPRDISIVDMKDFSNVFNQPGHFYNFYTLNPYYPIVKGSNKYHQTKTYGKVELEINPIKEVAVFYRLGFDYSNGEQKQMIPVIEMNPTDAQFHSYYGYNNDGSEKVVSSVKKVNNWRYELNHDIFGTYNQKWDKFDLGVTLGVNVNERSASSTEARVEGLTIPGFNDLSNSSSSPIVKESSWLRRSIGVYADVQLAYNNMVFLGLTARNDWSSTLPLKNNSFFYPGITASWVFTELLKDYNDILTFGKIRAAFGMTGNDASVYMTNPYYIPGYSYQEYVSTGMKFPFNGVNAYRIGNVLANPMLSPEITTEYEFGLNLNLLKGRIELDAAYYNKVSDKQIFSLNSDPAIGYSAMNTNLGQVENQGIELMLNVVPVKIKDFTWTIGVTFTKNFNKVLSLPAELGGEARLTGFGSESSGQTDMMAVVGQPIGQFKVTMPEFTPDGKIVVNALTGLPVNNSAGPQYVNKSINSDFEMGFNTALNYKGFTLSANFDWRAGGFMFSRTKNINVFTGNALATLYNDRQVMIVPNSVNKLPDGTFVENTTPIAPESMVEYNDGGRDQGLSADLIDRSYFKLRNLTLSYDFPSAWMRTVKLQGIRLSLFGNNLFVVTPSSNAYIDPEISTFGNDLLGKFGEYTANPTPRSFGLSLNVKF